MPNLKWTGGVIGTDGKIYSSVTGESVAAAMSTLKQGGLTAEAALPIYLRAQRLFVEDADVQLIRDISPDLVDADGRLESEAVLAIGKIVKEQWM